MPTHGDSPSNIDSRVSSLETSVESLTMSLRGFTESSRQDIASLHAGLAMAGRPQWSTYIGFAGIILTIVGMVGSAVMLGYGATQQRIEQQVHTLLERALSLEFERGKSTTQITALMTETTGPDTRLQREMRDVNSTTETKLTGLDKRLQDEMTRSAIIQQGIQSDVTAVIGTMKVFQDTAREDRGRYAEQMRALERKVFAEETKP